MTRFTLNNKLSTRTKFVLGPTPLIDAVPDSGILPMPAILEDGIGSEMVLLLVDKTPFIHQMAKLRPFNLYVKTGLVQTSCGPLLFLLFHVPTPGKPGTPFAMLDYHVDLFNPSMLATWRDLARQTHWHLVLVDGKGTVLNLLEFPNVYALGDALDRAVDIASEMSHGDFWAVKEEFCATYSLEDLYNQ
jgi:hypothetical protein